MRLGVISDTHGLLRPEVFELFDGVDRILHAGDIGPVEILTELEAIAPVTAVYGNTDGGEIRSRVPEQAELELEGLRFVIVHGHQLGQPTPDRLARSYPDADVIVYGHTHKPLLTLIEGVITLLNPGGAGARRFDLPASAAIMELEAGLPPRCRLVPLTPADED